jgi:eukaryotic-like serine/threonine-protein kinase
MVEGTSLQSRYRVDHRIAAGGMGAVYEAMDQRLGRLVAVKILKDELAHDPRFVERFRREARAVASLSHPNIANVYDYGEDRDAYFIVMELAPGEDLARLLRSTAPLSPDRAANIATQMCAALAHAHSAGIVHRDIKPANVIVGPGDRVKVTDFGIARAAGDLTLTATGSILGTAQYLSPEQAAGGVVGPPCDIYATGIVLYEMLTGTVPFTGGSAVAVAMKQVSDPVPPPSRLNAEVPPELDAAILKATAKDPGDRFAHATAMAGAIQDAIKPTEDATRVAAGPVPTLQSTRAAPAEGSVWPIPGDRWDARRVGRVVLISFGILMLLAGGLLAWRLIDDDRDPAAADRNRPRQEGAADPEQETPSPEETTPTAFTIRDSIEGSNFKDTERVLMENGVTVSRIDVDSEEEKDTIVDVDPSVGTTVTPGVDTITLYVSTGKTDEDDGDGPPEEPPGQDKKDEDDDD